MQNEVMRSKEERIVGIDVSKNKLDAVAHGSQDHTCTSNDVQGHERLLEWMEKLASSRKKLLVCFEDTGLYSMALEVFLSEKGIAHSKVPGLEVKRSSGIKRGKDDKVDAKAIARYAHQKREELRLSRMPSGTITRLKELASYRERLIEQKRVHETSRKEKEGTVPDGYGSSFVLEQEEELKDILNERIEKVEEKIEEELNNDEKLKEQDRLLRSVSGFGRTTALQMIVLTEGFEKFRKARKFNCFAGVAPFPDSSGKMDKGSKVSHLAHKRMKSLLHVAAMAALKSDPEIRSYYERKVKEGKNKMSVLNAVRNKLVGRAFAAIKRGTPYTVQGKHAQQPAA
jgi:transposase